jgi:hypothetical protein
MSIATYARTSGPGQRQQCTIKTQRVGFQKWCAAQNVVIPLGLQFEDDGRSGSIPLHLRPGGKRLLEAIAVSTRYAGKSCVTWASTSCPPRQAPSQNEMLTPGFATAGIL